MKPTRRTQPFRRGARVPSRPLKAAMRGATFGGQNPQDVTRALQKRKRRPRRRGRLAQRMLQRV